MLGVEFIAASFRLRSDFITTRYTWFTLRLYARHLAPLVLISGHFLWSSRQSSSYRPRNEVDRIIVDSRRQSIKPRHQQSVVLVSDVVRPTLISSRYTCRLSLCFTSNLTIVYPPLHVIAGRRHYSSFLSVVTLPSHAPLWLCWFPWLVTSLRGLLNLLDAPLTSGTARLFDALPKVLIIFSASVYI